jgi:hypothetical protein
VSAWESERRRYLPSARGETGGGPAHISREPPGPATRIRNTAALAGHGRAVRCPGIQKLHIQVRPPVEHRDKVDALAQTISEMASVSHVRQKEPLTATP